MKLLAIAIGLAAAACTGDPYVGTWTLEQSPHAATPAGCPMTTEAYLTLRVDATGSADVHTITVDGGSPWQAPLYHGQLQFEAMLPTNRADVGSAFYLLDAGGTGLVGTGGWQYLVGDAGSDPAGPCPELDVRSI
jgi:hypothetical protein